MWFFFALASGMAQVLRNMTMKQLGHSLDETINVWGRFAFLLPFALIATLWHGIPVWDQRIWVTCALFAIMQAVGTLSLSKGLKLTDMSLVISLWKLSLLFLIPWGFFLLDERPNGIGVAGVCISVLGVYLLNVRQRQLSLLAPLITIFRERGQRYTLISAFFYAPSVILMKQIVLFSDPYYGTFIAYLFTAALLTPYAIWRSARHFTSLHKHLFRFCWLGLFAALASLFGSVAYRLTLSTYVEAVKQVELPLALLIGYLVFHERTRVREIWPASMLIFAGVLLLKLAD